MSSLCAAALTLACLGTAPALDGPDGITPHVIGRFGVAAERGPEGTRTQVLGGVLVGFTWRHQTDNGTRLAFTLEAEVSNLPRDAWRR